MILTERDAHNEPENGTTRKTHEVRVGAKNGAEIMVQLSKRMIRGADRMSANIESVPRVSVGTKPSTLGIRLTQI
jgi:hypothetical protein